MNFWQVRPQFTIKVFLKDCGCCNPFSLGKGWCLMQMNVEHLEFYRWKTDSGGVFCYIRSKSWFSDDFIILLHVKAVTNVKYVSFFIGFWKNLWKRYKKSALLVFSSIFLTKFLHNWLFCVKKVLESVILCKKEVESVIFNEFFRKSVIFCKKMY